MHQLNELDDQVKHSCLVHSKECGNARSDLRGQGLRDEDAFVDLKLHVDAPGENIHWAAIGVVARINDELVVGVTFIEAVSA